jgi:hypothetical protein
MRFVRSGPVGAGVRVTQAKGDRFRLEFELDATRSRPQDDQISWFYSLQLNQMFGVSRKRDLSSSRATVLQDWWSARTARGGTPASASAQFIEAGATIGTGARGTESKLARQEARLVTGLHLSGWWADRLETAFRIGWIDLPDISSRGTYYYGCVPDANGRCLPTGRVEVIGRRIGERRLVAGQVLYHFRKGKKLRPHVGGGSAGP